MIALTRFNHTLFYLNAELIRSVEATPDTMITLLNESKFVVCESVDEVVERVIEYRRRVNTPLAAGQAQD
jgi:flagellar protein FlbD